MKDRSSVEIKTIKEYEKGYNNCVELGLITYIFRTIASLTTVRGRVSI